MKPNLSLAARLSEIRNKIETACKAIHKNPEEVTLVAVSKGQSFEKIREAYELGIRDFGESYAQEFKNKMALASLENMNDIKWHYLGAIQSNKIKIIIQADYIHSVDTIRHAESLSKAATQEKNIFLQVNLDHTRGRQGFEPQEIKAAFSACSALSYINIIGLMAILPLGVLGSEGSWFAKMRDLREQRLLPKLKLSMGMSQDFEEAIVYGADFIRIGTELFGARTTL